MDASSVSAEVTADEPLCSIPAEQAVLGALMVCGASLEASIDAAGHDARDYYEPLHGALYAEIVGRLRAGQEADPITLAAYADASPGLAALGGRRYVAELYGVLSDARQALAYAALVSDLAARRRLRAALQAATAALEVESAASVVETIDATVATLRDRSPQRATVSTVEAAEQAIEAISAAYESGGGYPPDALLTGLTELDRLSRGWRPGNLVVAAARASMGKSLFALHAARAAARAGLGVLYISLEMSARENLERAAATLSGVAYTDLAAGAIDERELVRVSEALAELAHLPIEWCERGGLTVDAIASLVRQRQRQTNAPPLRLIVVDHAGLVRAPGRGQYETQSAVVDGLKSIAQASAVALLCVAQINRAVEARDNKRPTLADLRDTGKFEENAHQVLLLYRDAYYAEREPEHSDAERDMQRLARASARTLEIDVAKNRAGRVGRATVYCDVATGLLANRDVDLRGERG